MKKYFLILVLTVSLLVTGCGTPSNGDAVIDTMEKMAEVTGVISVTEQAVSGSDGVVAYKMCYQSENGKLSADVVLPEDYVQSEKQYPVLLYFPQVNMDVESLATKYGEKGLIAVRPYARGRDQSEGTRDLGGNKDLADAQTLLKILDCARFIQKSKIFVMGSSEGSVTALRLIAQDKENRITGCAVVDIIADLPATCEFRGEDVKDLFGSLIGKTYEEAPEEYDLRSAVTFTQQLNRPLLLLHFTQNPAFSLDLTNEFYRLVKEENRECLYYKIDDLSCDFTKDAYKRLISWIEKYK